jgi:hypothetical protein
MKARMPNAKLLARAMALAARKPHLMPTMARAAWRFRRRGWWRRPPFLPLPSGAYVAWRAETAFGAEDAVPEARLLERYLRWTREMS